MDKGYFALNFRIDKLNKFRFFIYESYKKSMTV